MIKTKLLIFVLNVFLLSPLLSYAEYGTDVHTHEKDNLCAIHYPGSALAVVFPNDGFIQKDSREVGGPDSPNYFLFGDENRNLYFSGWFITNNEPPGIREYYDNMVDTYRNAGFSIPQNVSFDKIGGWDVLLYDNQYPEITDSHLRAHWLQAGTWLDIHISINTNLSSSEARSELTTLLKTIQVLEY